jgi:serine/threonine protein kinase/tetratricopeptide (TPR) repeat protein
LTDLSQSRFGVPLLAAGEILAGRFQIVGRLGEGAIGEVFEATDLELEEQVAIKVLRPEIARDPEVLHRFKREIQLARKVTHPGVCRTFDLFHHRWENGAELAFVTMELLRGETLEERLQRDGRMEPAEALPLIAQIAEGLQAAHQAGVVHRDFKSANVMLVQGPDLLRAVVTDFGLAWSSSVAASVTRTGTLIGSPAYMAPEQVRGEAVTPATDIYAFGIVLYEMVTGSLPFSADTAIGTAIKRLREPPTLPRVHAPGLDPLWEEVILRCLESDPADRFATPVEVVRALGDPRRSRASGSALRRQRRRRRFRWMLAAGVAAMAAGLVISVLAWRLRETPGRPSSDPSVPAASRPAVAVLGFENLSRDPEVDFVERSLVRLLPSELAAGERLRLIPGEQVSLARQELSLTGGNELAPETLERLRTRLGADFVITGSFLAGHGSGTRGRIRCAVAIQDARTGEVVALLSQEGTEEELLDLVDVLGVQLRDLLGAAALSRAEKRAVLAARPANTQAARLYAEGLDKLSRYETLQATSLLEQARDADPENALIRADLAVAWRALGWQTRAEEAAREAFRLSSGLGYEPRRRVEARFRETSRQWEQAAALYGELWTRFPDDLESGLGLARAQIQMDDAGAALDTVARLRSSGEPWRDSPRIDLAQAEASLSLGELDRGLEAAVRAQRKADAQGAPVVAARALHFQGNALRALGRLPEAQAAGERAHELFRQVGDLASAASALSTVGSVLTRQGDLAAARRRFEDIVAIGRAIGSEETRGLGLINIGVTLSEQGDMAGAGQHYEEALVIFRRTGSKRRASQTAQNLARVHQRLGRRAEARALFREAAATLGELGDRRSEATVLANLAAFSVEEGRLQEAWNLASRALAMHAETREAAGVAVDRGVQGRVLALRGDLAAAQRELRAAASSLDAQGEKLAAARQRIDLAGVLVEAGQAAAGESMARGALASLGATPAPDDELAARTVLILAALAQGRQDAAAAEVRRAERSSAACENRVIYLEAALARARAHAATGQAGDAAEELRALLAEAERGGLLPLARRARAALAGLGIKHPAV